MNKAWWVGLLCCLATGMGCSKDKTEPTPAGQPSSGAAAVKPAPAKVKLALDWVPEPEFGGFYAARESGAFARHGLEVEILGGGAGAPVAQMVATGQADFGTTSADGLLTARARGIDLIPLFATYQTTPHALMAHASKGFTNMAQLLSSGSTVALEPGLAYAQFLRKKYGFAKVKIVPYDGGVARFLADKDFVQQCFLTSEPLAARKQGGDPVVFKVADEGFNPYATVVVTRGELLKQQPERVRAFVDAVREGWRAYLDNPKPANDGMARLNTTMDAETFALVADTQRPLIETGETRARGLGTMSRERWETLGQQLVDLGIIEKAPPVDEYLRPDFLGAAAAASK
ncbi:ABC transporter substrate-binding protein [Vitiosangium sp. GDMCC 1.1324]|uniref:ABC transporter substrate-binding protein n=1 Tax=Vitiosangium sp. (strain GDMCC 1.1324) TaxID=2138576 RepID=UPI000D393501|nr:ABC transporter substrate-binding protein [Vitiosangium sp. GDMCC 1.1324]PTL82803.1 ABC transporter substrate-binding protein [Vitiosangium sp. GDMCC 1.1324]